VSKICPRCSELLPDDAGFCPFDGAELQKSSDRFLGRTIAARYRLTKKLGSGGMSVVYLARHELISRLSAIKILRPELARIPEHRERFLREARAVNRINHENIVEITDVGESDGVAYLVMEYVEGESLLAQIHAGPLRWERAAHIAIQVASALARTHQTGIIHRDLKPENILLVPRPAARPPAPGTMASPELVKLTDFGIAKMAGEPTLTLNEQLFGTPGYIAPEYVGGLDIDGRADIYSLAVVLYEMVTGQLPFEGRGQSELLLKPLTSAPIPPSRRISGLPPDLESLLLRCLAREPAERPHDAFALHDALVDILRRFGRGSIAPRAEAGSGSEAPAAIGDARDPIETIVDRASSPGLAARSVTGNAGKAVTMEMSSRWSAALAELETSIATARRAGGASAVLAGRAAELALVAGEMLPRVERAARMVSDLQAKVDRLEAVGREFRGNLGHAIDVLVHDRSRERAHLDALRARREVLQRALAGAPSVPSRAQDDPVPPSYADLPAGSEPRPWEMEALAAEERRAGGVVEDLGYQIATLQKQLDDKNEEHERTLVQATGALEGALSALRRLTNEIARTIDDGIDMLQRPP
jgi:eukaryotic-like serine/threonine-protein kinase